MKKTEDIKSARDQLLLSQEEFARVFEVSPRTVIRWESGQSVPQGAAAKKLQTLFELLANNQTLREIREVAKRSDGTEILRSLINQPGGNTSLDRISIDSARLLSGAGVGAGSWGLLPALGTLVGGATSLWGAYKILKKAYEGNPAVVGALPSGQFKCAVCGKQEKAELLHCTGMLADGPPCTFVVCKGCIYSSKDPHTKLSPTCNRIDVPAFEPVED